MIVALDFIIADESCSARPGEDSGHLINRVMLAFTGKREVYS
jgi:hypothetical protein